MEALESRHMMYGLAVHAEATVDLDQFAANIEKTMGTGDEINAVGYAYSISSGTHDSPDYKFVSNGHGLARLNQPEEFTFTADVSMEAASVSKIITATAFLKLIQDNIILSLGDNSDISDTALKQAVSDQLDEPMLTMLPADWQLIVEDALNDGIEDLKDQVAQVTYRDLLKHTSGFSSYRLTSDELQTLLEAGLDEAVGTDDYSSTNFSFLRELTPYLWGEVDNDILDGLKPTSDLPAYMQTALIDDWGDVDVTADKLRATLYRLYVQNHVLVPSGVFASTQSSQSSAYAYHLDGSGELDTGDQRLKAGGRGWNISATELRMFLTHLNSNESILRDGVRELMFEDQLGIFADSSLTGPTYGHSGGNMAGVGWSVWDEGTNQATPFSQQRVNTRADVFPNNVVAAIMINSQVGGDAYRADLITGTDLNGNGVIDEVVSDDEDTEITIGNGSWKTRMLVDAYDASLTAYVVDGDDNDNSFVVRHGNGGFDTTTIDIYLDGALLLSTSSTTLVKLELNGFDGADTFFIDDLPTDIELTINGGSSDDTIELGANEFGFDVDGDLLINGDDGSDSLIIKDSDGATLDYSLNNGMFSASSYGGVLQYLEIQELRLEATIFDNTVHVVEVADNVDLDLQLGQGSDIVTLDKIGASSIVQIDVGFGNDTVAVIETGSQSAVLIEAPAGGPASNDTLLLGGGNLGNVRGYVTFTGGNGADSILVDDSQAAIARDLHHFIAGVGNQERGYIEAPGTEFIGLEYVISGSVTLSAGPHDDEIVIDGTLRSAALTANGGLGNDEFHVVRAGRQLSALRSDLVVNGEDGKLPPDPNDIPVQLDHDELTIYDTNSAGDGYYEVSSSFIFGTITQGSHDVTYAQMERIQLSTSDQDDVFDVHSTALSSGPLILNSNGGDDFFRAVPVAQNQIFLRSSVVFRGGNGYDRLQVFDRNSLYNGTYSLSARMLRRDEAADVGFTDIESLYWHLNDEDNTVRVTSGNDGVTVNILAYEGNDELFAQDVRGELNFQGGTGTDSASLRLRKLTSDFVIQGHDIQYSLGTLRTDLVEQRTVIGTGNALIDVRGVAGISEQFELQPSTTSGAGKLVMNPYSPVNFEKIAEFEITGNPKDNDTLAMLGSRSKNGNTNQIDVFDIALGAAGTSIDPVVTLRSAQGKGRLKLRNYHNFGSLHVIGLGGADQFNVTANPVAGIDRFMHLIGGAGPGLDRLSVAYNDKADFAWADLGGGSGAMDFNFDDDPLLQLLYNDMDIVDAPSTL
jgi:hypothetical protein